MCKSQGLTKKKKQHHKSAQANDKNKSPAPEYKTKQNHNSLT